MQERVGRQRGAEMLMDISKLTSQEWSVQEERGKRAVTNAWWEEEEECEFQQTGHASTHTHTHTHTLSVYRPHTLPKTGPADWSNLPDSTQAQGSRGTSGIETTARITLVTAGTVGGGGCAKPSLSSQQQRESVTHPTQEIRMMMEEEDELMYSQMDLVLFLEINVF